MALAICGLAAAALLGAAATHARPKPADAASSPPGYGLDLIPYATVRRSDGTYRRMLIAPQVLRSMTPGAPLPDGTRILMETFYRPGEVSTVFHKEKVDGKWLYGSFASSRPDLSVRPQASCLSCHARAASTDFTFTLPSIRAASEGRGPSEFTCARGGRAPCALGLYREGAAP